MLGRLIIVEGEVRSRERMAEVLERSGFETTAVSGTDEALALLRARPFDAIVAGLPGLMEPGMVARIRELGGPDLVFIVVVDPRVRGQAPLGALRLGVDDYVTAPPDLCELGLRIEARLMGARAGEAPGAGLVRERADAQGTGSPRPTRRAAASGVIRTPGLAQVFDLLDGIASTGVSVLLTGETGTGKGVLARHLHEAGPRSGRPFISVNCSSLPGALLTSELFGHEEGAFTGASRRRVGRFEAAEDGTIFLDEIGDTALEVQSSLLRVLQDREFERLGSSRTMRARARVIAATNTDLPGAICGGRFRKDLYYRLASFAVEVPPLRERPEDIPVLARACLHGMSRELNKNVTAIDGEALRTLRAYDWPGNVRELENVLFRAVARSSGPSLGAADLSLARGRLPCESSAGRPTLRRTVLETERQLIAATLAASRGNHSEAARTLGIPRTTLLAMLKRHRLGVARG